MCILLIMQHSRESLLKNKKWGDLPEKKKSDKYASVFACHSSWGRGFLLRLGAGCFLVLPICIPPPSLFRFMSNWWLFFGAPGVSCALVTEMPAPSLPLRVPGPWLMLVSLQLLPLLSVTEQLWLRLLHQLLLVPKWRLQIWSKLLTATYWINVEFTSLGWAGFGLIKKKEIHHSGKGGHLCHAIGLPSFKIAFYFFCFLRLSKCSSSSPAPWAWQSSHRQFHGWSCAQNGLAIFSSSSASTQIGGNYFAEFFHGEKCFSPKF